MSNLSHHAPITSQLEEEYFKYLDTSVKSASGEFFMRHTEIDPTQQTQLQEAWRQRNRTSRAEENGTDRQEKKVIRGYIDGCYDIMHSGHFNAIRQAKSLCDWLVVGVHTNAEIEHHKGPPVMSDEERLAAVKACKWVDEVQFGVPYTPSIALLDQFNCDFAVHGDDDATTADGKDAFAEAKTAGRMKIVKRTEGVSTTDLVKRLLNVTKDAATSTEQSPTSANNSNGPSNGQSDTISSPPAPACVSGFLPTTWRISQFANHRQPKPSDTVVYIGGSFDLFHLGHIEKLEAAKKLGQFLYVGIYDDATVSHLKGKNYPVMSLHERVLNVLSCKYVDEVVIAAPFEITKDLLKTLNVSVIARASSTGPARPDSAPIPNPFTAVESLGIVKDIHTNSPLHTSTVIQRILDNRARYEKRNASRVVKDEAYANKKTYVEEM